MRTSAQRSWPWWRLILAGLTMLALVLSAIMSWHYLVGGSMAGCGSGSPCYQVLSSRWSVIAGILPVSGLAAGVYLALIVAVFFTGSDSETPVRRMAWSAMLVLAGSVAGSAVWFTIVQKWFIRDFCPWCMTTHITGLLLSLLIIWRTGKERENPSNKIQLISHLRRVVLTLSGLFLAGILAVSQSVFTPTAVNSTGESQDSLPTINYQSAPMVGSPDAPYVVTLLFDYQCSHCQKIHFMLGEAIDRYDGKLAFLLCPTPLNTQCNPYIPVDADAFKNSCELAKTGLAIWIADREAFHLFEKWMFTFESGDSWRPRSLEAARAKAAELVGKEKFDKAWADPWIGIYMQTCIQIYGQTIRNGSGGIPKLIYGSRWVFPEPYNASDLIMILQRSLAVPAY